MDEADFMANTPQAAGIIEPSDPVVAAKPEVSEKKARGRTDSEAEQRLLTIMELKQSGNETWKTELELFKESYPDYPLPDELKVP